MWLDGNSDLANQAYTHISNDGSDHSFIDQAVTSVSSPTFTKLTLNGDTNYISNTTMANGFLKISNNLAIDKYEIAFGNDGGMISVVGNNSLGFMVNGHWSFIANTGDYHTDYNIYAGTVQASHFIGIKVEDLPLARWRMAKVLTAPIAQGVETALSTIDAAWTGGWDNNNQVLIVIDGEINAPGIDYTLGTLNTLTFTYDVPTGSTLDIIVF
jgi:hypothetical protein